MEKREGENGALARWEGAGERGREREWGGEREREG